MAEIVDQHEVSLLLGLHVEKRRSRHLWADWIWSPRAVHLADERGVPSWTELERNGDRMLYHAGYLPLTLHRTDCEALAQNLALERPELYVVLRPARDGNGDFPWQPQLVTASAYEAQDFHDSDSFLIEKLEMPEPVAAFVQAFVEAHYEARPFVKRRRDRLDPDERKFGKTPIFTPLREQ